MIQITTSEQGQFVYMFISQNTLQGLWVMVVSGGNVTFIHNLW